MPPAKIVPPFRFSIVEEDVYRGAYPTLKNYPFLSKLGLKTIISLIPEPPIQDLEDFCSIHEIELLHYMVEKPKDEVVLNIKDAAEIVQTIIKPSKLPVYIHCLDGTDVTGLVICCLRRLQAWHKDAIGNEFSRCSRAGEVSSAVEKFVASFREIEISEEEPPQWLWHDEQKHPFIKLIKHRQGVVIQVVRPAQQEIRKKEVKQIISRQPPITAMRRPRKLNKKHESLPALPSVQDLTTEEEEGYGLILKDPSNAEDYTGNDSLHDSKRNSNDSACEASDEEDALDGYPSLLEALSLHKFSDNCKTFHKPTWN